MENAERISKPEFSQPLCTALQIALVDLLKSWNITPVAVLGHSSGEIAAAYATGMLSLESACRVAYHRGRLAGKLAISSSGAMMSVNISEEALPAYIEKVTLEINVHIACVNSPQNITISGEESDMDILQTYLDEDGIFARKLNTGVAYHSSAMEAISMEYLTCIGILSSGDVGKYPTVMISTVTGTPISTITASQAQY